MASKRKPGLQPQARSCPTNWLCYRRSLRLKKYLSTSPQRWRPGASISTLRVNRAAGQAMVDLVIWAQANWP